MYFFSSGLRSRTLALVVAGSEVKGDLGSTSLGFG